MQEGLLVQGRVYTYTSVHTLIPSIRPQKGKWIKNRKETSSSYHLTPATAFLGIESEFP